MASTSSNWSVISRFYDKVASENLPQVQLFGVKLNTYMDEQKKKIPFLNVPWLVRKCCDYLLANGLSSEGLFRVPGSHAIVNKLVDLFDHGKNFHFDDVPAFAEDVSGVLKKYLRDLPDALLSDGTAEDPLQDKFRECLTMPPEQMAATLNVLLKQLPLYRKALTFELFNLLYRVNAHNQVNLMNSDNLATIFGGMGDIISNKFTPSERSWCCKFMIENFEIIFDGLMDLAPQPDDSALSTAKEGIKIYLVDGTFKALICQGTETVKDMAAKTSQKLQQQLNIDCASYRMFEVRDMTVRPLGEAEKALQIVKSQSALIFSDQLVEPVKVAASPRRQNSNATLRRGTIREGKEGKEKKERSKRQTSKSKLTEKPAAASLLEDSTASSSEQAPVTPTSAEPATPANAPELEGSIMTFGTWAFFDIPAGSNRASDWDTEKATESDLAMFGVNDSERTIKLVCSGKAISPTSVTPVDDSSRYFVLSTAEGERIGVGFETREEAGKFKLAASPLMTESRSPAVAAVVDTLLFGSKTAAGVQFWTGPIDFKTPIEDGFYDAGLQVATEPQPSFDDILKQPADLGKREVILVNARCDARLVRLTQVALDLVRGALDLASKVKILALFVSNVMGGTDIASGFCALEEQQEERNSLSYLTARTIEFMRTRNNTNVIKLGQVTHGAARHRALLFKYLCDRMQPAIPTAVLRSDSNKYEGDLTWNYVAGFKPHQFIYVDLMHDPGRLYHASSTEVTQLTTALHGNLNSLSDATAAVSALKLGGLGGSSLAEASEPVTEQSLVLAQPDGADAKVQLFDLIGAGPDSKVFRGVVGQGFPVAIKEIPRSKGESVLEYIAYVVKLQHKNILPTFGHQITATNYRVVSALSGKRALKEYVRERKTWDGEFPEEQVWAYAAAVADGLAYLHSKDFFHGLVRAANVIVDGSFEPFPVVQLTDMMISPNQLALFKDSHKRQRWWAPEAIKAAETGDFKIDYRASDIWSVGMFLVELVTLQGPHPKLGQAERAAALSEGRFPANVPEASPFYESIKQCLQVDPSKRPTAAELATAFRSKLASS